MESSEISFVTDLNAIDARNNYVYSALYDGATASNAPTTQMGLVIGAYMYSKTNGCQLAIDFRTTNIYIRFLSGGSWSEWTTK